MPLYLLNVCDISSDNCENQLSITRRILSELGCNENKIVTVYNKCDKLTDEIDILVDDRNLCVSAKSGFGLDKLMERIENELCSTVRLKLAIPYDKLNLIGKIKKRGTVVSQDYNESGAELDAYVDKKDLYLVKEFIL